MVSADYHKVLVNPEMSLKEAVKMMNAVSLQVLLVVDNDHSLLGVLTDGDIRRALLDEVDFQSPISMVMTKNPFTLKRPAGKKNALELMKRKEIRHIPLVDSDNRVSGLLTWKDLFENGDIEINEKDNPVVIMAGGRGSRLDLFTRILPKPLIPIGEKPIISHIMDNFSKYGFRKFIICVNYKGEMIKFYFSENHQAYSIDFVEEPSFLGTAGALSLCHNMLNNSFIVSNCDVIIDTNIERLLNYHKDNKNHATIMSTIRNIKIPYGVLKSNKGALHEIIEKPEYSFIINSGVYVIEPALINLIPKNQVTDMPDLLLKAKNEGFKVQIYPMTCNWFDVGEWAEYKKAIEHITQLAPVTC